MPKGLFVRLYVDQLREKIQLIKYIWSGRVIFELREYKTSTKSNFAASQPEERDPEKPFLEAKVGVFM